MAFPKQPREELIVHAAELRANGLTWEAVAAQIGRAADTVRRWPNLYPEVWHRILNKAERQLLAEATAEAVLTLRKQLRSSDEKICRDAAQRLIQFRIAFDRCKKAKKPQEKEPVSSDLLRVASFLETLTDEERERLFEDLLAEAMAERSDIGRSETSASS